MSVGAQYPVHAELRGSFLLLFLRGGIIIIESAGLCSRMHAQFFHSSTGVITGFVKSCSLSEAGLIHLTQRLAS